MMSDVISDAMLIIRCLYDAGAVSAGSVDFKGRELIKLTCLSESEIDAADTYLLQAGFVEGTNGLDGSRWLTPSGVERYGKEKANRIPLSASAERIARYVSEQTADPASSPIKSRKIQSDLEIDDLTYRKACQELSDRGLLTDAYRVQQDPFAGVTLTPSGRNAVRDDFELKSMLSFEQNIGSIFHGPITNSTIQSIAVAANSNIQQAVNQGNTDALRAEIAQIVEKIVEAVKTELSVDQLSSYATTAKQLKEEVQKPNPDQTIIQRLSGLLSFAGNLDGAIELGKKGFELAVKVGPLILVLQQAIWQLLQHNP